MFFSSSCTKEPFVTVTVENEEKPLYVENNVKEALLGAATKREAARIVLRSLHTVKELRVMTRTGLKLVFERIGLQHTCLLHCMCTSRLNTAFIYFQAKVVGRERNGEALYVAFGYSAMGPR
jgi:hypothetical protein